MACLVSTNGVGEPYCIVFVGSFLHKDARKSVVEFFLFANRHYTFGKIADAKAERKRWGNAAMKKARSCDLAFRKVGAAGRNRTHDPLVRSQVLYPAELQPPEPCIIAAKCGFAKGKALFAIIRRTELRCAGLTYRRVTSWRATMRSPTFDELFAMLLAVQLSSSAVSRLREWIASIAHPAECIALVEAAAAGRPCPHCGCTRKHRCGHASGLQRFRCLNCRRSHNALTGTPLARLRKKECWLPYLQCVLESRTVRDAARVVKVHRTTSFRWRHRFVPGAMRDRPNTLTAIAEADETYRLESQKGSRSLVRPPRKRGAAVQLG